MLICWLESYSEILTRLVNSFPLSRPSAAAAACDGVICHDLLPVLPVSLPVCLQVQQRSRKINTPPSLCMSPTFLCSSRSPRSPSGSLAPSGLIPTLSQWNNWFTSGPHFTAHTHTKAEWDACCLWLPALISLINYSLIWCNHSCREPVWCLEELFVCNVQQGLCTVIDYDLICSDIANSGWIGGLLSRPVMEPVSRL